MNIISSSAVHKLPNDFKQALLNEQKLAEAWNTFTPLARNEWICWIISAEKDETRAKRIVVGLDKMRGGMRRPCCWAECPHR